MVNKVLYIFLIFIFCQPLHAQHRECQAMEHDEHLREESEAYDLARKKLEDDVEAYLKKKAFLKTNDASTVLTIPVVVHVIHKNASNAIGGTNISDTRIYSQIDVLNEDFRKLNADTSRTRSMFKSIAADARIEFCMATIDPNGNKTNGITRTFYNSSSCFTSSDEDEIAGIISWPTDQYLNIWVAELCNDLQGFAQLPAGSSEAGLPSSNTSKTDGVVVDWLFFGTIGSPAPYNLGRPCVHEVGHWLGLLHPWGNFGCGSTDFVNDTPTQNTYTYKCPANNTPCGEVTMFENFMGYDDDSCMTAFTAGQVNRMWAVLNSSPRRKSLFTSPGCCGSVCALPYYEMFDEEGQGTKDCLWDADSLNDWAKVGVGSYGNSDSSLKTIKPLAGVSDTNSFYTPGLNYLNTPQSVISFDYAYAGNGTTDTDTLTLAYALSCNKTWTTIASISGTMLVTTSNTTTTDFTPLSTEWKTFKMQVPNSLSGRIVRFRLQNISKKRNPIYIDNINVIKENDHLKVSLYPNPSTSGDINLDVIYEGTKDVKIDIYSVSGVEVYSSMQKNMTSYIYTIDTHDLEGAIYIVRITVDDETEIVRFMKK